MFPKIENNYYKKLKDYDFYKQLGLLDFQDHFEKVEIFVCKVEEWSLFLHGVQENRF